ncbi:DNA alkylation repair protein [bacterium]|nr:DNA alkylation repair protein [bacterium]
MNMLAIDKDLNALKNKSYAEHAQSFFKTGKGEYGEGDCFLGIRVPVLRKLAKQYKDIDLSTVQKLLDSKWHEKRLLGLFILIHQYKDNPDQVYKVYTNNFKNINNWDLVDTTCHKIIGPHLFDKDRSVLYTWARSKNLWTKRISMMTTYYFIQRNQFQDTLKLAEVLLDDEHDLIHKIVGWMLREVGKRSKATEDQFLKKHYKVMPRTMLRYAIEKYPQTERKKILNSSW